MDIHLVRVPQDVNVVNVTREPAKWRERPAFFSVHVDSYGFYKAFKIYIMYTHCNEVSFICCLLINDYDVMTHQLVSQINND